MMVVKVAKVQKHRGRRDCGLYAILYAIAFALHVALEDNPEHLVFIQAESVDIFSSVVKI